MTPVDIPGGARGHPHRAPHDGSLEQLRSESDLEFVDRDESIETDGDAL